MTRTVLTTLKALIAVAALAFASFSLATKPADAQVFQDVRHSCYAGCCGSCQGLCCGGDLVPTLDG